MVIDETSDVAECELGVRDGGFVIRPPLTGRIVHWTLTFVAWTAAALYFAALARRGSPLPILDATVLLGLLVVNGIVFVSSFRRGVRVHRDTLDVCERYRRITYRRSDIAAFEPPAPESVARLVTMRLTDGTAVPLRTTIRSVIRNQVVEEHHRRLSTWLHPTARGWPAPTGRQLPFEDGERTFARTSFVIRISAISWVVLAVICLAAVVGVFFGVNVARDWDDRAFELAMWLVLLVPAFLLLLGFRLTVRGEPEALLVGNSIVAQKLTPESIRSFSVMKIGPVGGVVIATLTDGKIVPLKATRRIVSAHVLQEHHQQLSWWLGR